MIGHAATLTPRNAVLMNAGLMHGLDYDDTHMKGIVHATAFCLPTALALAQETGGDGRERWSPMSPAWRPRSASGWRRGAASTMAASTATGIVGAFRRRADRRPHVWAERRGRSPPRRASPPAPPPPCQVFLEEGAWSKRVHPGWGGVGRHHRRAPGAARLRRPFPRPMRAASAFPRPSAGARRRGGLRRLHRAASARCGRSSGWR